MSLLTAPKASPDSFVNVIVPLALTVNSFWYLTVFAVGVCAETLSLGHAKIDADWS